MIAIYARQSIDKKDSISIESQIDCCKKEITDNYKVYSDKGYSGSNTNRPAFEHMIKDIENGTINTVIVYRIDRISRSILDFSSTMKIFEKFNISFISVTEKFDTQSPMGKAMLYIIMVFAQLERETIQMRLKDNVRARGKKGFFMGGQPPYGFDKKPIVIDGVKTSVLEPNEQSKFVISMYDLYSEESTSLADVKRHLMYNNATSAKGTNWATTTIAKIIKNPVYVKANVDVYNYFKAKDNIITNDIEDFKGIKGCYHYGKEDRTRTKKPENEHVLSIALHNGLIDSEVWLACQYKLKKNSSFKRKGTSNLSWLSGLIKCGYCGYSVTPNKIDNYIYLRCTGRNAYKICPHKKSFRQDKIEPYIQQELFKRIRNLNNIDISINKTSRMSEELNSLKLDLAKVNMQINDLLDKLEKANDILMNYINDKIIALDIHRKELTQKISEINIKNNKYQNSRIFESAKSIEKWEELTISSKNNIAKLFIKSISLKEDDTEIEWLL